MGGWVGAWIYGWVLPGLLLPATACYLACYCLMPAGLLLPPPCYCLLLPDACLHPATACCLHPATACCLPPCWLADWLAVFYAVYLLGKGLTCASGCSIAG